MMGFLDGDELLGAGSRHCRDVLRALGVLTRLCGVVPVTGVPERLVRGAGSLR